MIKGIKRLRGGEQQIILTYQPETLMSQRLLTREMEQSLITKKYSYIEKQKELEKKLDELEKKLNLIDEKVNMEYRFSPPTDLEAFLLSSPTLENAIEYKLREEISNHLFKPLSLGITISTLVAGIAIAITSPIFSIPIFILSAMFGMLYARLNHYKK